MGECETTRKTSMDIEGKTTKTYVLLGLLMLVVFLVGHVLNQRWVSRRAKALSAEIELRPDPQTMGLSLPGKHRLIKVQDPGGSAVERHFPKLVQHGRCGSKDPAVTIVYR